MWACGVRRTRENFDSWLNNPVFLCSTFGLGLNMESFFENVKSASLARHHKRKELTYISKILCRILIIELKSWTLMFCRHCKAMALLKIRQEKKRLYLINLCKCCTMYSTIHNFHLNRKESFSCFIKWNNWESKYKVKLSKSTVFYLNVKEMLGKRGRHSWKFSHYLAFLRYISLF